MGPGKYGGQKGLRLSLRKGQIQFGCRIPRIEWRTLQREKFEPRKETEMEEDKMKRHTASPTATKNPVREE